MEQNFWGEMTLEQVLKRLPPEYREVARELQQRRDRERRLVRVFNEVLREVDASERELARERAEIRASQRINAALAPRRSRAAKRGHR